jgi:DNA helicase-2/ATP-dependent DNA helicase PcrA
MDDLLDGLDARQREAVTTDARPLAIVAPAGSGKTRVLTRRIAWRTRRDDAEPRHVVAVTFTRKAAGELVERLAALSVAGVTAGTFHALALAQLRRRAHEQGRAAPTVVASKARLLAPILDARRRGRTVLISDVSAEIEWAKARGHTPDAYARAAIAAGRHPPLPPADLADAYARYEDEKRRRRCGDFDDLLAWCAAAIEQDATFAAAQRWRFRHLFVDEFQDATPLQIRLLRAWLGDRNDLCVVGDPAQAIYAFAGADAGPLTEFARHFPGGTVIALDRNYRSSPQIVAVAERALDAAAGVARTVGSVRADADAPTIRGFADDAAEAVAVAQGCWEAYVEGVPWNRIAVLFRTNAQSARFEAACARRGVPCRLPASGRFVDRPIVRALLDELRAAARDGLGRPFSQHLADVTAAADPAHADTVESEPGADAAAELRAHRAELAALGRDYLATEDGPGSVAGFVGWLDLATRGEQDAGTGVELLTFHRAKGLEWRVVFVTGLEHGLVPISWATGPEQLAEERRLLHVALGRAEDSLHLSWAERRGKPRDHRPRAPSPWLEALAHGVAAVAPAPVDRRAGLADVRAALAAANPPQPVPRRARRHR